MGRICVIWGGHILCAWVRTYCVRFGVVIVCVIWVWCGVVWCGVAWCAVVWCAVMCCYHYLNKKMLLFWLVACTYKPLWQSWLFVQENRSDSSRKLGVIITIFLLRVALRFRFANIGVTIAFFRKWNKTSLLFFKNWAFFFEKHNDKCSQFFARFL